MNTAEIVVHEIKGQRVMMILNLFRESIRQPRKTPHGHSHCKVLALNVAGRNVPRIGLACDSRSNRPNAFSRAVAFLRLRAIAVQLDQHRIVDVIPKGVLNRLQIHAVAVRRKLNAIGKAACQIVHESLGGLHSTVAEGEGSNQLRIGVNRNPRPHIAITKLALLFSRDILLLGIAELPDFIALDSLARQVAKRLILIFRTCLSNLSQQFENGVLRYARHSHSGANGVSFHEGRDYRCLAFNVECVHGCYYA